MPYFTKYICFYRLNDNNVLLLNTLTKAMDVIDNETFDKIQNMIIEKEETSIEKDSDLFTKLKRRGYIFNSLLDEQEFLNKFENKKDEIMQNNFITEFTICPTMGCNLRCTYCHENHKEHENFSILSEKSLNIILDYISKYILEFRNVSFKYPNTEKSVIRNMNFKIETGEKIALVGKNGCGKTTLINLILRIFDPTEGTVLLNGIDIKEYEYEEYLKFFSAVFQDYQLYAVKLCDYISFGNVKNSENTLKIKQAVTSATADEFIKKSKNGFESKLTTLFDKQGLELSGGQWQKLAIARTFFSDANMLIFDEPTSALDSISESKIYKNIEQLGKDKTSIFISHRMYSSKLAKRIIYIENGEILNDGTHEELMKNSTGYKELFEEQANKYVIEKDGWKPQKKDERNGF